jgi:hypothetical protein
MNLDHLPIGRLRTLWTCLAVSALAVPLAGCGFETCTLSVEPGIRVEVRDRTTNEFLAATPRGVAREGTFQDSLEVSGFSTDVPPRVATLDGNVGTGRYTLHLAADGYQPWDTAGVRVTEGDCGVRTTSFTAALAMP